MNLVKIGVTVIDMDGAVIEFDQLRYSDEGFNYTAEAEVQAANGRTYQFSGEQAKALRWWIEGRSADVLRQYRESQNNLPDYETFKRNEMACAGCGQPLVWNKMLRRFACPTQTCDYIND